MSIGEKNWACDAPIKLTTRGWDKPHVGISDWRWLEEQLHHFKMQGKLNAGGGTAEDSGFFFQLFQKACKDHDLRFFQHL